MNEQIIAQALRAFESDIGYVIVIVESVAYKNPPPVARVPRPRPVRVRPASPARIRPVYEFPVVSRFVEPTMAPAPEVTPQDWAARKAAGAAKRDVTEAELEERRARDRARYWAKRGEVPVRRKLSEEERRERNTEAQRKRRERLSDEQKEQIRVKQNEWQTRKRQEGMDALRAAREFRQ